MSRSLTATVVFALCVFGTQAFASQTIYYPDQNHPEFSVTAPDDWKIEAAEEAGGFFDINGPTGALVSMRTVAGGGEEEINQAVKDTITWIDENYKDVQISDPKIVKGQSVKGGGEGKDKKDGHAVTFALAWVRLANDKVIEIWACVDKGDEAGAKAALQILTTVKAH